MTKWEYLRLDVSYDTSIFSGDKITNISSNGISILKDVKRQDLHNHLAQLGKDGWELVHVFSWGAGRTEAHYFKRPIKN